MRFSVLILVMCLLHSSLALSGQESGISHFETPLKLPDYYIARWEVASTRGGDYSYIIKADGTMEARWNWGKKEKYEDITYRVLSLEPDKPILFIRQTYTSEYRKKNKDHSDGIHYGYWTMTSFNKNNDQYSGLLITSATISLGKRFTDKPEEKSDDWLLQYFYDENVENYPGSAVPYFKTSSNVRP